MYDFWGVSGDHFFTDTCSEKIPLGKIQMQKCSIGYIISNIHQLGCLNKFIAYFKIYDNEFETRPEEK